MLRLLPIVVAAGFLLTACGGDKEKVWGTYQEPVEPVELPEPTGATELSVLWKKSVGAGAEKGFAILQPAYGNNGLYVAGRKGTVERLDPADGSTVWRTRIGEPVFSGVGTDGVIVVIALDDGSVVALDAEDGETVWEARINRQISAVPAVGKGRVIVRTADGLLLGLDSVSGETAWTVERAVPGLSIHGESTPVISGDAVLAGLANGKLVANNVVTGREYWETELSFARGQNELERLVDADTRPLVVGNRVFTATYQDTVAALQLQNAAVLWKAKVASRLPVSLQDGRLYVTDTEGRVVAINAETGEVSWIQESFRGRGVSRPLGIAGRVVFGDAEGNVHSLDATNGDLLESRRAVGGAVVALVEVDGHFAVYSSEGKISALALKPSLDL